MAVFHIRHRLIYLRNAVIVFISTLIIVYWHLGSNITMDIVPESSNDIVVDTIHMHLDQHEHSYINIMLCCDEKSKPGLYAVIHSIVLHHKCAHNEHLYFHILVENNADVFASEFVVLFHHFIHNETSCIKYEFKSFIQYDAAYSFFDDYHRNDLAQHNLNIQYIFNAMNYARFYLPDIFTTITGNALYIDIDTIVRSDISQIYYQEDDCPLHAVYNVDYASMFNVDNLFGLQALGFNVTNDTKDSFKLKRGFNAGVALYNFCYWRDNDLTAQYESIMKVNKQQANDIFSLGTQPIMNILFRDMHNKCNLNRWWNALGLGCLKLGGNQWSRIQENANILHWNGHNKPWIKCDRDFDSLQLHCKWRHKEVWRQYLPKAFDKDLINNWNDDWHFYE